MAELSNLDTDGLFRLVDHMQAKILQREVKCPEPLWTNKDEEDKGKKDTRLTQWLRMESWTETEAAMLVSGFDPSTYQEHGEPPIPYIVGLCGNPFRGSACLYAANKVLDLLQRRSGPPTRLTPADFVAWCSGVGIDTAWLREVPKSDISPPRGKSGISRPQSRRTHWQELVFSKFAQFEIDPLNLSPLDGKLSKEKQMARDALVPIHMTESNFLRGWQDLLNEERIQHRK